MVSEIKILTDEILTCKVDLFEKYPADNLTCYSDTTFSIDQEGDYHFHIHINMMENQTTARLSSGEARLLAEYILGVLKSKS